MYTRVWYTAVYKGWVVSIIVNALIADPERLGREGMRLPGHSNETTTMSVIEEESKLRICFLRNMREVEN